MLILLLILSIVLSNKQYYCSLCYRFLLYTNVTDQEIVNKKSENKLKFAQSTTLKISICLQLLEADVLNGLDLDTMYYHTHTYRFLVEN